MTTLKPGSMLLGTTRPAELRAWYAKALAPESTGEGAIDLEAQLNAAGVEWISVADREKGRFGTFADPDGNYLQIIEWKKDA